MARWRVHGLHHLSGVCHTMEAHSSCCHCSEAQCATQREVIPRLESKAAVITVNLSKLLAAGWKATCGGTLHVQQACSASTAMTLRHMTQQLQTSMGCWRARHRACPVLEQASLQALWPGQSLQLHRMAGEPSALSR